MTLKKCLQGLMLSVLLSACAAPPIAIDAQSSFAWGTPEDTVLGNFFTNLSAHHKDHSGLQLLSAGHDAFLARYAFANQAEETIDLQYYLWKGDQTGLALLHKIIDAADRGVRVRFLIDDIYHQGRDRDYAIIASHPNIQVRLFNPMSSRGLAKNANFALRKSAANHRMHNKIFLVDNAVAVLGGRNIGDDYFDIDPDLNFEDLDVLAAGPVAQETGIAYDTYWNSKHAVPIEQLYKKPVTLADLNALRDGLERDHDGQLAGIPYEVPLDKGALMEKLRALGERMVWAQADIIIDPLDRFDGGSESVFVAIGRRLSEQAQQEVVIQTAYLIPTAEGVEHLRAMIDRGVKVRIMTNSLMSNNHMSVHAFYRKYRKDLLNAGVDLYELRADSELLEYYKKTNQRIADSNAGLHTKAFVIDQRWSMVGSYNMDPRSRIWNSEIGLLVDSPEFARRVLAEMNEEFESTNAYRLSLNENGKIIWTLDLPEGLETWTHDPDASIWRRFLVRLFGWLPLENEL